MTIALLTPDAVQQFSDANGTPLAGGKLFCYAAGTTTKQAVYTDVSANTALPNPIVLNARGEVAASSNGTSCGLWLYPTSAYKFVLAPAGDSDPPSSPIWTVDNINSNQLPSGVQYGDFKNSAIGIEASGWRLCYGQTRPQTDPFWQYIIAQALQSSWKPGYNNLTNTYTMPDARDLVFAGLDNMGGTPKGLITQGVAGFNPAQLLNSGGDQNVAPHTIHTTVTITDNGHTHPYLTVGGPGSTVQGGVNQINNAQTSATTTSATTGITATAASTDTATGAGANLQPTMMAAVLMYVGA